MHVDKLGDYRTRDGRRVRVHTIKTNRTFSVQGAIYQMFRGKERTRGFHIWQPNGRFMALQEHKLDLVEFIG